MCALIAFLCQCAVEHYTNEHTKQKQFARPLVDFDKKLSHSYNFSIIIISSSTFISRKLVLNHKCAWQQLQIEQVCFQFKLKSRNTLLELSPTFKKKTDS